MSQPPLPGKIGERREAAVTQATISTDRRAMTDMKKLNSSQVSVLGLNFKTFGFICGELLWFEVRIVIEMSNELYLETKKANKTSFHF